MTNKQLIFAIFIVFTCMTNEYILSEEIPINLQDLGNHGTHHGIPFIPADQPEVYYDNVAQVVIIDGTGYSVYYDVDIFSCDDGQLMIHDSVNGNYDTIDVSTLPDDDYEIVITSSYNNVFEGYFTME